MRYFPKYEIWHHGEKTIGMDDGFGAADGDAFKVSVPLESTTAAGRATMAFPKMNTEQPIP